MSDGRRKRFGHQMTATAITHEGFYASFGAAVRVAREAVEMTQADLADRIGLSRPGIANIESGRQGVLLHHGLDIAAALDTPLEKLLAAAIDSAREAEIEQLNDRIRALKAMRSKQSQKATG